MNHEDLISISCTVCNSPVHFKLHTFDSSRPIISECSHCGKVYGIEPGTISRQIGLFVDLCKQLKKSEEILNSASIAVTVGPHEVKIPFKILLTRLRSTLDLDIGGTKLSVTYRTEPLKVAQSIEAADYGDSDKKEFQSLM